MTWLPPWVRHIGRPSGGRYRGEGCCRLIARAARFGLCALAGLPLEVGLYASLAPLVVYAAPAPVGGNR